MRWLLRLPESATYSKMRVLFILLCTFIHPISAIFEDQVGKFDWRKELVGCPKEVVFDKIGSKSDRLIISSEQSVLASLELNTGNIGWRRIMENPSEDGLVFTKDNEYIYTISQDGRSVRVWRKSGGVLARQIQISDEKSKIHAIHVANEKIHVASGKTVQIWTQGSEKPLETRISKAERSFSAFFQNREDSSVIHVSSFVGADDILEIVKINDDGAFETEKQLKFDKFHPGKCHHQSAYISCSSGSDVFIADVFTSKIEKIDLDTEILEISGKDRLILARGAQKLHILEVTLGNGIQVRKSVDISPSEAVGIVENEEFVILADSQNIRVVSVNSGTHFSAKREKLAQNFENSPPKSIFSRKNGQEFEILMVGEDCRLEMITVDGQQKMANLEWFREESLINAASVEMVDLPLSESQQMIEDEFEEGESNIISAFIRRIQVQFGQFVRFITKTIEKSIFVITSISKNGNGFSDFISSVRTSGSSAPSGPFERDYFNLRKVIIVTTSSGTIFGIDSANGQYLWKLWLGDRFVPLRSSIFSENSEKRVPLFVQRTTAHYQLDGLASVVFSDKISGNGVIVSFNPMIGKIESRTELGYPIKRVSLLPVHNQKHVYPVILIGKNEQIKIVPSISPEELSTTTSSLYLLDILDSGVGGLKIDISTQRIENVWSGNLGLTENDRIIVVKGKSFTQKVHSQGRVLVSRDVQYKYVNPNLAAIASLNSKNQQLTITLLDIVTGQIVHQGAVAKAAGPVHLVHSEHWIAYTYWSEKGRRTELGIIELYEGSEDQKAPKDLFDSKILQKSPPTVLQQSYIYAQGVDAMSVSETEQGLTTRSILVAHPTGNIHEVSRRLLDATRPMELTQAMREEMMIGYMPEIAVATEEMINYNQTVHRVRGIKTSPSGLESTSLVLAYGTDLFFTRLVPSGTFDILKDDFDHVLISLVLTGLLVGSYVTKRWARSNALASQWA